MHTPIHLHTLEYLHTRASSKRLNIFHGRAMTEAAFDKTQDYIAERMAPLLSSVWPGIMQGLEVEYLSIQQQTKTNPDKYKKGLLIKTAYNSYRPAYPADEFMQSISLADYHYSQSSQAEKTNQIKNPPKLNVSKIKKFKFNKPGMVSNIPGFTAIPFINALKVASINPKLLMTDNLFSVVKENNAVEEVDIAIDSDENIEALFKIKSGRAVTASGTVVNLFHPLEVKWQDLLARSNLTNDKNVSGLYLLCLGREIIPVDFNESPACRRYEEDALRDTRFETVGYLQLLPVENFLFDDTDLLEKNRHKAINRYLTQLVLAPQKTSLPKTMASLGFLAIKKQKITWFESLGGRFLSHPQSMPMAFLAHTEQVFAELIVANETFSPAKALQNILSETKNNFQALPAAGSLPRSLLSNVTSIDPPLPKFEIDYAGLRVDMVPVPKSAISGILRRELGRGVIRFSDSSEERLRLLIMVPDAEYHPDLLNVPFSDSALSEQLYDYAIKSYESWLQWREQLEKLYSQSYDATYEAAIDDQKLSTKERDKLGIPDLTESRFNPPLAARNPALDTASLPSNPAQYSSDYFFDRLIFKRGKEDKNNNFKRLPPPYREGVPANTGYDLWLSQYEGLPQPDNNEEPGIIIKRAEIEKDIDLRTDEMERSRKYVDEINDLLLLQRQQLDSQTVSFAAFAGGVAGDGSGLQIARWLPAVKFEIDNTNTGKNGGGTTPSSKKADNSNQSVKYFNTSYSATSGYKSFFQANSDLSSLQFLKNEGSYNNNNFDYKLAYNTAYISQAENNITNSNYEMTTGLLRGISKINSIPLKIAPLSSGQFKIANQNFGVLKHISVINSEFTNSHVAVQSLQDKIDDLVDNINEFIGFLPEKIKQKLSSRAITKFFTLSRIALPLNKDLGNDAKLYNALFNTSKSLIREISEVERLRTQLIRLQKILRIYIQNEEINLKATDRDIVQNKNNLIQLDALRREALEDYAAAQRLLTEHWQAVEASFHHRNVVLNNMLGLYYVKVRETASSIALPDVQSLGYAEAGDLVPGCRADEAMKLPAELDVFVETVQNIPMAHWWLLSTKLNMLPERHRLLHLVERRRLRMKNWQRQILPSNSSRIRGMSALRNQNLFIFNGFLSRQFVSVNSLKNLQLEVAGILSLEDLQNNYAGSRLRQQAQRLSNDIELAAGCFLKKLNDLPPSIRLQWGQLAEDNYLPIAYPEKWPEIEMAEDAAFNSLRTCLELVRWFNRQLVKNTESDSRSAMQNLIRACLMLAASDDPGDLLEGKLQVSPGRLNLGSILRLSLNQEAVPGAMLQLLNANKQTVAMLRLDDQDNTGATATVVNILEADSEVTAQQYMVIGNKYRNV